MSYLADETEDLARMAEAYHHLATCEHLSPRIAARRLGCVGGTLRKYIRAGEVPTHTYVSVDEGGRVSYALRWPAIREWYEGRKN